MMFEEKMARNLDEYDYRDKLTFIAEYYDFDDFLEKKLLLNYYPCDNTLELWDRGLDRVYLKRSTCQGVTKRDMFVGNIVRIYSRQIKILDYADCHTRDIISRTKEHTVAIIKPSAMNKLGDVITDIEQREFQIIRMRMCNLNRKEALDLYESKKGDSFLPFVLEHVVSGPIVALELVGVDAIERFKKICGPVDPIEARKSDPTCLRAIYGQQKASNGFHSPEDIAAAKKEACFFFPEGINKRPPETTVLLENTTCCVIKPHAIKEGKLGHILKAINESEFKITAMQMFYLSNANADEFLEVYKGVVADFHALMLSFIDGPLVALEIGGKHPEMKVHQEFRKFAGPSDSDIARQIRPYTLRAQFGVDKYRNAIHCTDLPTDTVLELEYFFKILDN